MCRGSVVRVQASTLISSAFHARMNCLVHQIGPRLRTHLHARFAARTICWLFSSSPMQNAMLSPSSR